MGRSAAATVFKTVQSVPKWRTTMEFRLTGLFDTVSIDVSGSIIFGKTEQKYLLVTVEHLNGWPISRATKYDTSDDALKFLKKRLFFVLSCRRRPYLGTESVLQQVRFKDLWEKIRSRENKSYNTPDVKWAGWKNSQIHREVDSGNNVPEAAYPD